MEGDTIAGIASGMGGGIGIIRVSGPDAFFAVGRIFRTKKYLDSFSEKEEKEWDEEYFLKKDSHTIQYGFIVNEKSEVIDEVIVLLMKSPRSYTREDVIEIDSHGGALVLQKILKCLLSAGVRLAEPGEFTKRAFLHGRMDLSQAEAVMKMISSKSEFALDTAVKQLEGSLSRYIGEIREALLYHMGEIEAALDDPEHYSLDGYSEKLEKVIGEQLLRLEKLLKNFDNGRMWSEGIQTVIVGKPNAGKSSLMNLLLDEERAIVTNVAGTTRDILEESFRLGDLVLNLVDTAGIHETEDTVESIGVKKAVDYLNQADFVIYVVDILDHFNREDEEIISLLKNKKGVILLNKSDLETDASMNSELFDMLGWKQITFSAKEGLGLYELEEYITELFLQGDISYNDQVYLTNLRHKEAVEHAQESLNQVLCAIQDGMPEDVLMVDLMDAYSSLGLISGETASEDLVNKIFEEFCMGK
ncbi:MAG: tRNA uridine-5-carboxymethylaminomethyl(34) synthesis GTPase MnmE [Lachnospiraceae bacterium]|nr:tRNA uridine-5-carboxymethylaminomethyl(34) synthesis GTPase MnmE [Lachnospiraceae bacterium]